MKEWMTAAEIGSLSLSGLGATERSVQRVAVRDCWKSAGPTKARKRTGRGGGWEYHVSCLPEAAQADWQSRRENALTKASSAPTPAKRTAEPTTQLSARRRRVMEARAQVLSEVQRRVMADGKSQRQAILSLIADFKGDQAVDEGQRTLPAPLFDACGAANDKGRGLSARGVYRWLDQKQSAGTAGLAPQSSRPTASQDAWPWLPRLLRFYCQPQKPSLAKAHDDLVRSGLVNEAISYDQCKRAVASLSGSTRYLDAHRGREGAIQLKARMAFTRRDTSMLDPTSVYIADGKTFDAEIAHPFHGRPFKPEITSILDVATRRCVGWSVGLAETSDAVADALRMAVERYGIPAIFYSDRGPGYRNKRMDGEVYGLCARLGTTTHHSLPYNSQARGIIERFNGSVWNRHAQTYPSYLGAPMDREASNSVYKQSRAEMKEMGISSLICGWDRFIEQATAAVAEYNAAPHSALRVRDTLTGRWIDRSPDMAWDDAVQAGVVPFPLNAGEGDDLFRPYLERTAQRGEVRYNTNVYFHHDLQPFDGMKVLVGYDIHDATKVWVRSKDAEGGLGPLICVATFAGNSEHYMPRSTLQAATERRHKGRIARAMVKVDEIEEELRAPLLVEHQDTTPLPEILDPVRAEEPIPIRPRQYIEQPQNPEEEIISKDVILATDLLSGKVEMTDGLFELMRRFRRYGVGDRLMEHHGLDPEAMKTLMQDFQKTRGTPQ